MGVEILIMAVVNDPYLRGEPVVIKEQPCEWGDKEVPPNWVRLVIPDATYEQTKSFLDPLRSVFEYEVLDANENGKRIKISIEPKIVEIFGADKGMRAELYFYLQETYGAVNVPALTDLPYTYVLDFPVPDLDVQSLKEDFEDKAQQSLAPHRFYFSDADVDTALAQSGIVTLTRAQAASRIIDRLA